MKHLPILAVLLTSTALTAQLDGSWSPISGRDGAVPPPSGFESMVTILQDQEVLVFADGETWLFDGTNWRQAATGGPSARFGAALAFDPQRARTVLFGGFDVNLNLLEETWEWDGTNWTRVPTAQSPGLRHSAGMAFDSNSNRVVLFGGEDAGDNIVGETWTFDGSNWTRENTTTTPVDRSRPAMASALGTGVVMFGGRTTSFDQVGDTWIWNGTDWAEVLPPAGTSTPPARSGAGLAFDPFLNRGILAAGVVNSTVTLPGFPMGVQVQGLRDSWSFDIATSTWTEIATQSTLSPSIDRSVAFDPIAGEVLLRSATDPFTYALRGDFTGAARVEAQVGACGGPLAFELPTLARLAGDLPRPGSLFTVRALTPSPTVNLATFLIGGSDRVFNNRLLPIDLSDFGLPSYSLAGVGAFSCRLQVSADVGFSTPVFNQRADLTVRIPTNPALLGTEVFFQALAPENGGFFQNGVGSTNVLSVTIGN